MEKLISLQEQFRKQFEEERKNNPEAVINITGRYAPFFRTEILTIVDEDLCYNGCDKPSPCHYILKFDNAECAQFYLEQYYKILKEQEGEGIIRKSDNLILSEDKMCLRLSDTEARIVEQREISKEDKEVFISVANALSPFISQQQNKVLNEIINTKL